MTELYRLNPNGPQWPYSSSQLRRDEPHLSLSLELPDFELSALATIDPPILVWRIRPVNRPADTREEKYEQAIPSMIDGIPYQNWIAVPTSAVEKAAWDSRYGPQPDWLGFAGWLYNFSPIATAISAARASTDPQGEPATTGLPAALQEARLNQNYPAWAATWGQFLLASRMEIEPLIEITAQAVVCHLPAEFIATLNPQAPSEGAP